MTPDTAGSAGQDRITATAAQPLAIYEGLFKGLTKVWSP